MKRNNLLGSLACVLVLVGLFATQARADSYAVDTVHSTILFRVKHMGVSYAYGRFNDFTGKIEATDAGVTGVDVTVKADSIDSGNQKRDQHLKSPDFFNSKQFPTITFKGKQAKKGDADTFDVTGDLTLHGATHPVTVKLKKTGAGKNQKGAKLQGYETTFSIKRSEFGMKNMLEGIGDDVVITVSLECAAE